MTRKYMTSKLTRLVKNCLLNVILLLKPINQMYYQSNCNVLPGFSLFSLTTSRVFPSCTAITLPLISSFDMASVTKKSPTIIVDLKTDLGITEFHGILLVLRQAYYACKKSRRK